MIPKNFKRKRPQTPARMTGPPKDGLWDKFVPLIINKTFPNHVHPPGSKLEWVSKDGRRTKISDMATKHIINTIRLIDRGAHPKWIKKSKFHTALNEELSWRKQMGKHNITSQSDSPKAAIPNIFDEAPPELSEGGIFFKYVDNERDHE